jgi:DNA sulfur modification protein DndE
MKLTKLRLCKEASSKLRYSSGRTGLTPNLLCRIGFCLSLAEPSSPNPEMYQEDDREFNRYTLLGEYDELFVALLRQRCVSAGMDDKHLTEMFRAHMNRGAILVSGRLKNISDLVDLL